MRDPVVETIHVAKGRRLPMQPKESVEVEAGKGIVGDRYHGTRHRHVTVQSRTSLDEAAEVYGRAVPSEPDPAQPHAQPRRRAARPRVPAPDR
ncbi:hypothetical protein G5V59_03275 [Nocardioides sp. W3-2-3]|uniref:hypothetical protein n=1 Tax=Nocardioides convexus TaxID=2712224 RepID=UPI0024181E6E|nr:hypothetical protein [Nocardioides convexus]NGZ99720.1 hypothetical protein [Nocardioides convexus]